MKSLVAGLFDRVVRNGSLSVYWPDGSRTDHGSGEPRAAFRLRDRATVRRIALHPQLAVPEAYMDGALEPEGCSIFTVLDVLLRNLSRDDGHVLLALAGTARRALRRIRQFNPAARSRRNVAHHYDLNGTLYALFLDRDRQYSCAYFPRGDETIEEAQAAKKRHIAAKLMLDRPGLSVLDIGCGWGGMALTLAEDYGARVTGITLSTEQLQVARARAMERGLSDRVRFELRDYRAETGRYDRIVSVGMFEHVGIDHYGRFFATVRDRLSQDGVALIHTIGRSDGPGATGPFIRKYIFPGGYVPALSEIMPAIERSGLVMTDTEVLRLHYAKTIALWRERFARNRATIRILYDERFCRMFKFYLAGAELAFRHQHQVNFQIQLARSMERLPICRDYMTQDERPLCRTRDSDAIQHMPSQGVSFGQ